MKILITGTTGFIGRTLFSHLSQQDHEVYGTVRRNPGKNEILCDITQPDFATNLPQGDFDVIIHTVGCVDQTIPRKEMFRINAGGTQNMLDWGKVHGCKHFIQISSTSVYGYTCMGEYRSEKTPRCRVAGIPYMTSKAKAEALIEKSSLPYTTLRLPGVLGEEDSYLSPAIVPRLLSGDFTFCGSDDKLVSTLFVDNFLLILDRILEHGPLNESFNCTDHTTTWRTLIKEYARILNVEAGDSRVSFVGNIKRQLDDKHFALITSFSRFGAHYPNDKLRARLGSLPLKYSWEDGVATAVKGYLKANNIEIGSTESPELKKTVNA